MKKTISIIIGLFAIMCISSSVHAAPITWSSSGPGAIVTVGSTGTQFDFTASPGVIVNGGNDITTYCILTGNGKAGENAIAYCVTSGNGKVGQLAITTLTPASAASALGTPTTDGSLATGFTTK